MRLRAGALLLCCAVAPAQTPAEFDLAYAGLLAASTATERSSEAMRASDLFLALPAGDDRERRLAEGVHATLEAGRAGVALAIVREARGDANNTPLLVTVHLRALAREGPFADFVSRARAHLAEHGPAVHTALRAEEGSLLSKADAALRSGRTADGRFVFEQIAALEPPDPVRLANFALCLRHLGEVDAARAVYERARHLAPDDDEIENDFGLFLRATGHAAPALAAFQRSWQLSLAAPPEQRGRGPAITSLVHLEALRPAAGGQDPLPAAAAALALRPDAAMLRRLVLDVALDRLQARAPR